MGTDRDLSELLEMAKGLTGYEATRTKLLKQYPGTAELSQSDHKYFVGRAARIARQCIDNGGTIEEVKAALTHLMLCIDARKYGFNARQYYIDNVAVLDRKYQIAAE